MLKLFAAEHTDTEVLLKQWRFPCGEAGIKIEAPFFTPEGECAVIEMVWEGNDDLMTLAQLVDAVRHQGVDKIGLDVAYFPYSRQDRRCQKGEGHALKVVGQFINSLGFDYVITKDAHSTVLEAVVDRLIVVPQHECAAGLPVYDYLIAPDAGAAKKVEQHAQVTMGNTKAVFASKTRTVDGRVVSRIAPGDFCAMEGKRLCVVDDLCDGGATFIALAKELVVAGIDAPAVLDLYVTHGFFTKGVDVLLEHYDTIYTNNLMRPEFRGQVKEI